MVDVTALPVEEVPRDCFIANSFTFGPCPCGCGTFKLVAFDEAGVARAMVAIDVGQAVEMAVMAAVMQAGAAPPPGETKETKH